ncbi:MAG: T9SS type A sorting domain-containing protein [Ignavibacteriaceae bacterium]|nr:T9SS type A sorting domain-containing protein [Ignavibacteriaceae bacterium]
MNFIVLGLLIISLYQNISSQNQPLIQAELILSDLTETRTIKFGIDPSASDGIDSNFGEEALPPLPPGIEFRFVLPANGFSGIESYKDYRQGTVPFSGQVEHRIKYQKGQGSLLTISYNLPPQIYINVMDLFGGFVVNTQFLGAGIYSIPNLDLGQLKLIINYNQAPADIELESDKLPSYCSLEQNYPNPFNPLTLIKFNLPDPTYVSLTVFDTLGNEIETLVNKELNAGQYSFQFNASKYPSGVYFYRLITNELRLVKKMLLEK